MCVRKVQCRCLLTELPRQDADSHHSRCGSVPTSEQVGDTERDKESCRAEEGTISEEEPVVNVANAKSEAAWRRCTSNVLRRRRWQERQAGDWKALREAIWPRT